jgi:hypothetical protein
MRDFFLSMSKENIFQKFYRHKIFENSWCSVENEKRKFLMPSGERKQDNLVLFLF